MNSEMISRTSACCAAVATRLQSSMGKTSELLEIGGKAFLGAGSYPIGRNKVHYSDHRVKFSSELITLLIYQPPAEAYKLDYLVKHC